MKIVTILGARPQFIKASAIHCAIERFNQSNHNKTIQEVLVHTGQHFDKNMSGVFFGQLEITEPKYNLGISSLDHGAMTGQMIEAIEVILKEEKADYVIVYGDTNSTLAGALAAVKLHIPILHIEAGLRSHNLAMPEEVNRVLTDRISSMLFCPTKTAYKNLKNEGYPFKSVNGKVQLARIVGDVMYDVTLRNRTHVEKMICLEKWKITAGHYALCTIHRAENTNDIDRLQNILSALSEISKECTIVFPIHPRTLRILREANKLDLLRKLVILEPTDYFEMQRLQIDAKVILTDSGGIQKEAFFHRVPCITLRNETEWLETLTNGWNQIAGASKERILAAFNIARKIKIKEIDSIFGDGNASDLIIQTLREFHDSNTPASI